MNVPNNIYCSLDPTLILANSKRTMARTRIEIIPFNKKEFDFISFAEFATQILIAFYSKNVTTKEEKKSKVIVYRKKYRNLKTNYDFLIEFGFKMSYTHVYIKNNMIDFDYIDNTGELCIKLENQYHCTFDQMVGSHTKNKDDSLLYHVATYFTSEKHECQECLKSFFIQFQSLTTQRKKERCFRW